MTDDDPEEAGPTPEQLLNRAKVASAKFVRAREAMLQKKSEFAALEYLHAKEVARVARAALPRLKVIQGGRA